MLEIGFEYLNFRLLQLVVRSNPSSSWEDFVSNIKYQYKIIYGKLTTYKI